MIYVSNLVKTFKKRRCISIRCNNIFFILNFFKLKFKKEKWQLNREKDLRDLMDNLKRLITSNGGKLNTKRKVSEIYEIDEEMNEDSSGNKIELKLSTKRKVSEIYEVNEEMDEDSSRNKAEKIREF